MARIPLNSLPAGTILQGPAQLPAVGATALVYTHGTTSQVLVYSTETGTATLNQPLTADNNGQLPGWVAAEQSLDIVATYKGAASPTYVTEPVAGPDLSVRGGTFYAAAPPYNVKADGRTVTDAAIIAGQAALSSASAAFTSADQGKLCVVVAAGTPLSTTTTAGLTSGAGVTTLAVTALGSAFPPGGIVISSGANTQQFVTSGALAGATSIPLLGPIVGGLTSALSTGAPITSLPCAPLNFALASGTACIISIDSSGVLHTQTFTTAGAAIGATSIPVTSATPNFTYPESTTIFGSPISLNANFSYPSGSAVKTNVPALSTTISSVNGGIATLAANAGTTVSGAECFYATDDTTGTLACKTAAEAVNGTMILPEGDIGLSAAVSSSVALAIVGQGVKELYGGTDGHNTVNWPTLVPYLKGTVLVQCAASTDAIQLLAAGRTQTVRNLGIRFAGRFQNTGHGISGALPGGGFGNIGGVYEDVRVFGIDGNHYGFVADSPELMRWSGLRSYGGGGMWFKTNANIPSVPGNVTSLDWYSCTFIAGMGQGVLIDGSGAPNLIGFDSCDFHNLEAAVRTPSPALANTTPPPNGGAQNPLQTFNSALMTLMGFTDPGFESDPTGGTITWPNGWTCWRTNDPNAFSGASSQAYPTGTPSLGTAYQNQVGKQILAYNEYLLQPLAAASASTTLNGATGSGAASIVVTSATGISTGSVLQIDTGVNTEIALVSSVSGTTVNLLTPGNFGLELSHNSGVTVQVGAAVIFQQVSSQNVWPGKRFGSATAKIGEGNRVVGMPSMAVPTNWWFRFDGGNVARWWTDYIGAFG